MTYIATKLRPAPPLLLGAGLLIWGWQTGLLIYALPMAVFLELSHWIKWRCSITDKEYNIISDVSGLVFFILVVYIFSNDGAGGIYKILSIMPFILYLLILGQVYGERGAIKLSALFISLRRLETDSTLNMDREIDLSLPYFLLCIISASSGNRYPTLFFLTLCLLIAVVLWSVRPGRYHPILWAGMLTFSLSVAYGGQTGMKHVQRSIEMVLMDVFEKYMWRYRDPDRASTAIGSLGRIKLSDRIFLRVDTEKKLEKPLLLREASYTNYGYSVWSNTESEFQLIDPDLTPGSWTLQPKKGENSITISTYKINEIEVAPLPHGTTSIYDINAFDIERNNYGTVRIESTDGWISYRTDYETGRIPDEQPNKNDFYIPDRFRKDFNQLAREWQLEARTPSEIIETVKRNFSKHYKYSLNHRSRYPRGRYLHNFLFDSKEGHCEYFATSTVLLLRAAGIPARYAVGYSVNEYSDLEDQYVVRGRDAHSWALAYVDGAWRIVDTTPSVWIPQALENTSRFESLFDLAAWLKYRYTRWQADDDLDEESSNTDFLLWLLPPLMLFLIWRLYHRKRPDKEEQHVPADSKKHADWPGKDSAMYQLITTLEQQGYYRRPGETLAVWFERLGMEPKATEITQALELHYRYRFDPAGNNSDIRSRINGIVSAILDSYPSKGGVRS